MADRGQRRGIKGRVTAEASSSGCCSLLNAGGYVQWGRHLARKFHWLILLLILAAAGFYAYRFFSPKPGQYVAVPKLPSGIISLRVAIVINPRLPRMSSEQVEHMMVSARHAAKVHFGVDVRFAEPDEYPIADLFGRFSRETMAHLDRDIFDFKGNRGDRDRLFRSLVNDLRRDEDGLEFMIAFARPHVLEPISENSYEGLAKALLVTQLDRLEGFASLNTPEGGALIDGLPYNEVLYWDDVGLLSFPYDVIITNQLVASAEYKNNQVHSAIRGGVTNGLTSWNRAATFGTTAMVSTYPFIGEDPVTRELRGRESYAPLDAARFAGLLLVHELGHQLFHYGHPFGQSACVMNPPQLLRFRYWAEQLAPKQCLPGSSRAMTAGAVKIYVKDTW
jgi:hypothetical protein